MYHVNDKAVIKLVVMAINENGVANGNTVNREVLRVFYSIPCTFF